jgi:CHAT domain-containing protein
MHTLILDYMISSTWIHVFGISTRFENVRTTSYRLDLNKAAPGLELSLRRVSDADSFAAVESEWREWDFLVSMAETWSEEGDLIYLLPHGSLHGLPLHLLQVGGRVLIERNIVAYAPSLSALRLCMRRKQASTLLERRVVVFGDSREDLPSASAEAVEIAGLLGAKPMLGSRVTQEEVESAAVGASIVHFAGHGVLGATDPLDAGIALAGGKTLTARRIFEVGRFGSGLVVLSGCETGVNELKRGDELIGLTRALLYAGASSLVASLWRVEDRATAFFMRDFYSIIDAAPELSIASALREAALKTRANKEWASAFFWGPFVLIGSSSLN